MKAKKQIIKIITNARILKTEVSVSKSKFRRGVSQFTKAVREFGERRSEFDSKDNQGANGKQRARITQGRLTIPPPKMGIFMRSKMSEVVVRGGRGPHLDEINQARLNDDLQEIIRLSNEGGEFTALRAHNNIRPALCEESDAKSEIVDDPPTPPSHGSHQTRFADVGQRCKETGPSLVRRFAPRATSTNERGVSGFRTVQRSNPTSRRRLLFPKSGPDKENSPESTRLPSGCLSLKDLYRTFASSYVSDVRKVYADFVTKEGHSSIQRTREELTASFRKTCEKVLTEEGKSVDEENILNMTLQICGPSPKPGTVSSLTDYKKRNRELFPDTESEGEEKGGTPVQPPPSNLFGLDLSKYPFAPAVRPSPPRSPSVAQSEEEDEVEEVVDYSPEVPVEPLGNTMNPLLFIRQTLGTKKPQRMSVFDVLTPSKPSPHRPPPLAVFPPSDCPRAVRSTNYGRLRYAAQPTLGSYEPPTTRRHDTEDYGRLRYAVQPSYESLPTGRNDAEDYGRLRYAAQPSYKPLTTGRYCLSTQGTIDYGILRYVAQTPLGSYDPLLPCSPQFSRHNSVQECQRKLQHDRGNWNHHLGADDRTLMNESSQILRRLDCLTDEEKPRYVSPVQRFYRQRLF